MLEKTLESPLDCKEIKPVNPKGNQSWIFIGRTDAEAEPLILWPPDAKNWLTRKDPDPGKDWRQEEKGMTENGLASPTQWTWVWISSRSWWWTGKPGMLQSMGSQRVGRDWVTELTKLNWLQNGSCLSAWEAFTMCHSYFWPGCPISNDHSAVLSTVNLEAVASRSCGNHNRLQRRRGWWQWSLSQNCQRLPRNV